MKLKYYIYFFLIFKVQFGFSQYITHNASFEDNSFPSSPTATQIDKSFEYVSVWVGDQSNYQTCHEDESNDEYNNIYLHSPDWFHSLNRPIRELIWNGATWQWETIIPISGGSFVGMGACELIQQRFFSQDRPLNTGEYTLSFYFRIATGSDLGFGWSNVYSNDFANINILLSNKSIEYQNSSCSYWCSSCICSKFEDYCIKKNKLNQDIIVADQIPVSLNSFPTGTWHKVSTTLNINNNNFEYLVLELQRPSSWISGSNCGVYILIDDVIFVCSNGCSSTAGAEYITINQLHTNDNPFTIFGLKNKTDLHLKIYGIPGNEVVTEYNIPNPQNIISWNGKHYLYGTELAPAYYYYEATITNDCGTKIYDGLISKTNHTYDPTNDVGPNFNYNPVSKPPLPECCQEYIVLHNQYLVQDKTIGAPDPLLYKADIGISAGPAVIIEEDNTVIFEAGQAIDLLPGFTVEQGAQFTATITPCEGFSNKSIMSENNFSFSNENDPEYRNLTESDSHKIENFQIHPNPFSDSFTISFTQPEQTDAKIYLTDAYGRQVLGIFNCSIDKGQHSIDVSTDGITKGLYFCIMETPSGRNVVKVVKTK